MSEEKDRSAKAEKKKKKNVPLFRVNKKGKHVSRLLNLLRFLLYPIHRLVYPFKLHGAYKVSDGPCIYVGNHYCLWDIFYVAHTTSEGVHFLAKQSVLDAPIIGYFAHKVGVIGAMRDGSDVRTLMDSMKVLKHGDKLSIFPEGTRNKVSDEEFLPFRGGAAMIAIKTQMPVIPLVICNRPRVFRKTHIVFGEPMEFTDFYGKKLTQEDYSRADELLRNRMYEMRDNFRKQQEEKKAKKKDKKACK